MSAEVRPEPTANTLKVVGELATWVLAPAGVMTAVLFYFGYVRERALFAHFGVDLEVLDLSTSDYLVRSAGSAFSLLATVLVAGIAAVIANYVVVVLLSRANTDRRRRVWSCLAAFALALLSLGALGLWRRGGVVGGSAVAPIALGAGAVLLEYTASIDRKFATAPAQLSAALHETRTPRRLLLIGAFLVAAFWATANLASNNGRATAEAIEKSLPIQPQAVVYSAERLQITGPGVGFEELDAQNAALRFRYNGLRVLLYASDRWFLVPVGWTNANGSTVILLLDRTDGLRVDLAP